MKVKEVVEFCLLDFIIWVVQFKILWILKKAIRGWNKILIGLKKNYQNRKITICALYSFSISFMFTRLEQKWGNVNEPKK